MQVYIYVITLHKVVTPFLPGDSPFIPGLKKQAVTFRKSTRKELGITANKE